MTSCQKYDYSLGLQASKQALESSIVAWLQKESNKTSPGCAVISLAEFETDVANDETTISSDDSVGFRDAAMEQPWWLAMSESCACNFTQQTCAVLQPLQIRTLHSESPKETSTVHDDNNLAFATSQPWPPLEPTCSAEFPSTSMKFGVQLIRSNTATLVKWTVDAKKMRSTDRVVVSPLFMLLLSGQPMPFRMMLVPAAVCRRRGGHCFKRARGRGSVQLKCEASDIREDVNTNIQFTLCVGEGPLRGPVEHDLRHAMLCGLPRDQADWNFGEAEDVASHTFTVRLTVLHNGTP